MKKVLILILALAMVLSFAACAKSPEKPVEGEKPDNPAPSASSGNLVPTVDPRIEFIGAAAWVPLSDDAQGKDNPASITLGKGEYDKLVIVDNELLVQVHANDGNYKTAMSFEIADELGTTVLFLNKESNDAQGDKYANAYVREDVKEAALQEYKKAAN